MVLKFLHCQKRMVGHTLMEFQIIFFLLQILLTLITLLNLIEKLPFILHLNYQSFILFRFELFYFFNLLHLHFLLFLNGLSYLETNYFKTPLLYYFWFLQLNQYYLLKTIEDHPLYLNLFDLQQIIQLH